MIAKTATLREYPTHFVGECRATEPTQFFLLRTYEHRVTVGIQRQHNHARLAISCIGVMLI